MGRAILNRVIKQSPQLRVAGLCDPDMRSIRTAMEQLGSEPPVVDDYRELLRQPDVQWVMIASWNNQHCEHTVAAFEAGKNVFCQKPLATSLQDCLRMRDAGKASGRMFNIGFTLRYSPHYRKIKELVSSGAIGKLVSMEFNETLDFNHGGYIMGDWRRLRQNAGTHLLEKCCHDIDLANWIVDSRAARVASFGGLDFFKPENEGQIARIGCRDDGKPAYSTWNGLIQLNPFTSDKDIVDNQVAIIEYENSVRATFHTNANAGIRERRMLLLGTEGAIRADVITGRIELNRIGFKTETEDLSTSVKGSHGGGDDQLACELVESMLRGVPPAVGLEEGMASAITCFAIDDAMESGQVVSVQPYWDKVESP